MSNSITPVRGTITNPFGSIFSDRFFDSFFNDAPVYGVSRSNRRDGGFSPRFNVQQNETGYTISVAAPGVYSLIWRALPAGRRDGAGSTPRPDAPWRRRASAMIRRMSLPLAAAFAALALRTSATIGSCSLSLLAILGVPHQLVRRAMIRRARCSLISRCRGTGSEAPDTGLW